MPNLLGYILSLISYVLLSLGLYTIANRRGIRNAWLAWVPVGSIWILGSIADDYRARNTGRKRNFRIWLTSLHVATLVLSVIVLCCCFAVMLNVLTVEELTDLYAYSMGMEGDLYSESPEEMARQLETKMEERITDEVATTMLVETLILLAVCVLMLIVAIASLALEMICTYRLLESCDPQNKLLYFLVGFFLGVMPVFIFLCRNKDLGLQSPRPPVTGYTPPVQDPPAWDQN